ncbi:hypothetical protein X975_26255, partial [Stegodyphus mimosarum]
MVPKKAVEWRPVECLLNGDYQFLNAQTGKEKYPIPCIGDFSLELHDFAAFSIAVDESTDITGIGQLAVSVQDVTDE